MKTFKAVLNAILFLVFLVILITGLAKFPELKKYFTFLFKTFSSSGVSAAHDWGSLALILLVAIHLLLNRKRIHHVYGNETRYSRIIIDAVILIPLFACFIFGLLLAVQYIPERSPRTLPSVEVKKYKGERLDSINKFRENSIKGPQRVNKKKYRLKITGLVKEDQSLKYDEVLKLPAYKKVVQLDCVEGWSAKVLWQGVLLEDLIGEAKPKKQANTVIFYAYDGYSTSLPLDYILKNRILLANKINDTTLPPERGFPFQLVAEDKWGYKWIKWVTKIKLSDDEEFRGYWERRGYNNKGDRSGPKFEP